MTLPFVEHHEIAVSPFLQLVKDPLHDPLALSATPLSFIPLTNFLRVLSVSNLIKLQKWGLHKKYKEVPIQKNLQVLSSNYNTQLLLTQLLKGWN